MVPRMRSDLADGTEGWSSTELQLWSGSTPPGRDSGCRSRSKGDKTRGSRPRVDLLEKFLVVSLPKREQEEIQILIS